TSWQEGPGFALITIDQVGVRQRFKGGPIKPVKARALTIPARPDAYGKRARDFNNLKFSFALDPETNMRCMALVEAQSSTSNGKTSGTKPQPNVVFWLVRGVNQKPDPKVLPTDDDFVNVIEESVESLLQHPIPTN